MTNATRTLILAAALIVAPAAALAQSAAGDISGKWSFSVQSEAGTGTPTVTFVQKGDSISGRYSSQALGERDFTGTVKDGKITFAFTAELQGQQFTMTFSGTVESKDAMKGTIDFSGMATGTFTGKRAAP